MIAFLPLRLKDSKFHKEHSSFSKYFFLAKKQISQRLFSPLLPLTYSPTLLFSSSVIASEAKQSLAFSPSPSLVFLKIPRRYKPLPVDLVRYHDLMGTTLIIAQVGDREIIRIAYPESVFVDPLCDNTHCIA